VTELVCLFVAEKQIGSTVHNAEDADEAETQGITSLIQRRSCV
jgi:hypothetical protein